MNTYEFTLTFRLPERDHVPEDAVERLASAGCDDAVVGTGIPGRVNLQFDRQANSAQEAIETAITNVATAIPGAILIQATPVRQWDEQIQENIDSGKLDKITEKALLSIRKAKEL